MTTPEKTIADLERVAPHGFVIRRFMGPPMYSVLVLKSDYSLRKRHGYKPTLSAAIAQALGETEKP